MAGVLVSVTEIRLVTDPRGDIDSVVEVVEDPEIRTVDDSVAEIRGEGDTLGDAVTLRLI